MGKRTTEELILTLSSIGVPYDPTMSYAEMSKLIKEHNEKNAKPTENAKVDENTMPDAPESTENDEKPLVGEVVSPTAVKAPKGRKTQGMVKYNLFHNDRHYKKGELVNTTDPYFEEIVSLGHVA